jgi:hypothetical protein
MTALDTLSSLGFRDDAVRRFQAAYCGPPTGRNTDGWLVIDGILGPKTEDCINWVTNNGNRLATHFTIPEIACRHCGEPYVRRELLSALEVLREEFNRPIYLLGAYRCPTHNHEVGGVGDSIHTIGGACDIDLSRSPITVAQAQRVQRFSGIGNRGILASHLDVRHLFPSQNRTKGATPTTPARWSY